MEGILAWLQCVGYVGCFLTESCWWALLGLIVLELTHRASMLVPQLLRPRAGKLGLGTAYVHGLQYASGDFVFFLDADLSHHVRLLYAENLYCTAVHHHHVQWESLASLESQVQRQRPVTDAAFALRCSPSIYQNSSGVAPHTLLSTTDLLKCHTCVFMMPTMANN